MASRSILGGIGRIRRFMQLASLPMEELLDGLRDLQRGPKFSAGDYNLAKSTPRLLAAMLETDGTLDANSPVLATLAAVDRSALTTRMFQRMWEAHPHNFQADAAQNTSSPEVNATHGLPSWMDNTCAIRISVMLNETGDEISPARATAAGLRRAPRYSRATGKYYIVAASEMWRYLQHTFRAPDLVFPTTGTYRTRQSFQRAFDSEIKPLLAGRKGIVGFEKIFGFSGTGHVDLFDGETISAAKEWYPCQRLRIWTVVVPEVITVRAPL